MTSQIASNLASIVYLLKINYLLPVNLYDLKTKNFKNTETKGEPMFGFKNKVYLSSRKLNMVYSL